MIQIVPEVGARVGVCCHEPHCYVHVYENKPVVNGELLSWLYVCRECCDIVFRIGVVSSTLLTVRTWTDVDANKVQLPDSFKGTN